MPELLEGFLDNAFNENVISGDICQSRLTGFTGYTGSK